MQPIAKRTRSSVKQIEKQQIEKELKKQPYSRSSVKQIKPFVELVQPLLIFYDPNASRETRMISIQTIMQIVLDNIELIYDEQIIDSTPEKMNRLQKIIYEKVCEFKQDLEKLNIKCNLYDIVCNLKLIIEEKILLKYRKSAGVATLQARLT